MDLSAPSKTISISPIISSSKGFMKTLVGSPTLSFRSRSPNLRATLAITGASSLPYYRLKLEDKYLAITEVSGDGGDGAGNGNRYVGGGYGNEGFDKNKPMFGWPEAEVEAEDRSVNLAANGYNRVDGGDGANSLIVSAELSNGFLAYDSVFMKSGVDVLIKKMAANADFMCANLPVVVPANIDDALQAATSYLLLQRSSATVVGTIVIDTQTNARRAICNNESEDIPLSTGVRYSDYSLYMALVTNLEYQVLAGGVDPRFVEPLSRQQKLMLSADCDIQVLIESQTGSWIPKKITLCLKGAICLGRQLF